MQRLGTLIEKLNEQYAKNAESEAMMMTAQMIINELAIAKKNAAPASGSVTVLMPAQQLSASTTLISHDDSTTFSEPPQEMHNNADAVSETIQPTADSEVYLLETNEDNTDDQLTPTPAPTQQPANTSTPKKPSDFVNAQQWLFDLQNEIPTLAQQPIPTQQSDSGTLNEKLKSNQNELGNLLKNSPIKDLKKAIGINDRYRFINELFRGDESMFERSIKTINGFSVFGEAEVWIKRELKTKLGWEDDNETTQLFDHFVNRRFL